MRSLVDVIKYGMLRAKRCPTKAYCGCELDFDHMPARHAAAFSEGVNESFVKIDYEGFSGKRGGGWIGGF